MTDHDKQRRTRQKPACAALWGWPPGGLGIAFVLGIIFWGGFNTAMEWTNREAFCISCHEMKDNVYAEYRNTIHYQNRTGVRATCPDCHVPKEWGPRSSARSRRATRSAQGAGHHRHAGEVQRQARRTGRPRVGRMKANDSQECRNCHNFTYMDYAEQNRRSATQAPGGVQRRADLHRLPQGHRAHAAADHRAGEHRCAQERRKRCARGTSRTCEKLTFGRRGVGLRRIAVVRQEECDDQRVAAGGARWGLLLGRSAAPTTLWCSRDGRAAELTALTGVRFVQTCCGKSEHEARLRRAAHRAVLLGDPQVAPTGHRLPRGTTGGMRAGGAPPWSPRTWAGLCRAACAAPRSAGARGLRIAARRAVERIVSEVRFPGGLRSSAPGRATVFRVNPFPSFEAA
jgi:cytochrome c-type protein NapC